MPYLQDHFLDNRNEWPLRNDWRVSMGLGAGDFAYLIERRVEEGHSIAWKELPIPAGTPYKVHTVMQRVSGGNHGYGVIWRGSDRDNCYAFEIAASGFFKIKFLSVAKSQLSILLLDIWYNSCPSLEQLDW